MVREGLISLGWGWDRLLQEGSGSSSSATFDDDDVWTPLKTTDFIHLGVTVAYQFLVLAVVAHLWVCRKWPPYIPRQITLVCITGIAGVVAYCGALIAYGVVEREEGDLLANCAVEGLFDYTGWGVWTSVALVRVYRSWKILVRHSVDMWPAWGQVALISVPWLLPVIAYSIKPELAEFNERGNWCDINRPIDTALYVYGCVPIIGAFFLSFQMRKVRKQMNFFRMQVVQLLFLLLLGTVAFPLLESWLETRDDIRRTWIMYDNLVISMILFWPPIAEPMWRYLTGDEEYLMSYTKGFSDLPTPSQMRSSLKDQLSLAELRSEFEKFADSKVARELPDFYKACLDREEISDFFERQAKTTAIIDRFVRIGAVQEVNISGAIREKILSTEITSYNIFNEAMADVLKTMDNNFRNEFHNSEAFKTLERVVVEEAQELERLRQANQLPPKDHVESEPRGILKLIRRVSESVGTRSSKDGSESRASLAHTQSSSGRTRDALEQDLGDDFNEDGTVRRLSEKRGRPPQLDCLEEESKQSAEGDHLRNGGNGNDVHRYFGELDDQHAPISRSATEAAAAAAAAASVAEGEELLRQQRRIRSAAAAAAAAAERPPPGGEDPTASASATSNDPSSSRPNSSPTAASRPTSGSSTATMPTTRAPPPPSNTIFAVGNPRAAPPPPSAFRGAPGSISSSSHGGGGGGGGTRAAGVDFGGLPGAQHVSPPLTGQSSEESRSVSWCSDNYTNNTFSSECSSVSGRGYGGFGAPGSARLMRGVSGSSAGSVFLRSSSHINSARRGSGSGGDGGYDVHEVPKGEDGGDGGGSGGSGGGGRGGGDDSPSISSGITGGNAEPSPEVVVSSPPRGDIASEMSPPGGSYLSPERAGRAGSGVASNLQAAEPPSSAAAAPPAVEVNYDAALDEGNPPKTPPQATTTSAAAGAAGAAGEFWDVEAGGGGLAPGLGLRAATTPPRRPPRRRFRSQSSVEFG
eukprot:g11615.t1